MKRKRNDADSKSNAELPQRSSSSLPSSQEIAPVPASQLPFFQTPAAPSSPTSFDASNEAREKREQIERELLPVFSIKGLETKGDNSLLERMVYHHVPGVSIVIIDDGELVSAAGYGSSSGTQKVTLHTLFQAASVSKPVSAMAALKAVDEGKISLDEDIRLHLKSWKIPSGEFSDVPVTLRQLLSHTAGFNVSGFNGYSSRTPKTIKEVLEGGEAINHEPIKIINEPGKQHNYSGGGYSVMQLLLEDLNDGKPFEESMAEMFRELGMQESSFDLSSLESRVSPVARSHDKGGKQLACQYHYYPEKAAAGLWTTPVDLVLFAKELLAGFNNQKTKILSSKMIKMMLTEILPGSEYGLGMVVKKDPEGQIVSFQHSGVNKGFRANMLMLPHTGQGIIVMTNGENGDAIIDEITRTVASVYNWPQYQPVSKTIDRESPKEYDSYVGEFTLNIDNNLKFDMAVTQTDENSLKIVLPYPSLDRIQTLIFYPESTGKFINPMTGLTFIFDTSAEDDNAKIRMELLDGKSFEGERKPPELELAKTPRM